jgi:hypothetical protein
MKPLPPHGHRLTKSQCLRLIEQHATATWSTRSEREEYGWRQTFAADGVALFYIYVSNAHDEVRAVRL